MNISIDSLKRALHLQENIEKMQAELGSLFGQVGAKVLDVATSGMVSATKMIEAIPVGKTKRTMSAAARKKIAAAQKKRWAKSKESKPAATVAEKPTKKKKGKMSAAGRAAIVAAQKARWAKVKAEKK